MTLTNRPRFIDPKKCTGCGDCSRNCPVAAVNDINKGMDDRRATYIEYAQAVPLAYAIDTDACVGCGLCEKVCLAKAIKYDDAEKETEVKVGSLILSPGTKGYDPSKLEFYGY
ncbi:MAG: 4Fe-4S dicluster domain-containing protein, partial [Desulfobacterales bacterium]|nr:4Fe-4S dicluster domain-containing protein [Desulfobacterales bacterium]